ncbi:MAG: hypothetical protein ACLT3H_04685 [Roseburia sp.]
MSSNEYEWYKNNDDDNIWLDNFDRLGERIFSFDKKENPYWANFFKDRT